MPAYVIFGLGAAVTIAISLLLNKIVLKTIKLSTLEYAFLFHASGWLGIAFLFFAPVSVNQIVSILPFASAASITWILGDILALYCLRRIDAAIVGSLFMFKLLAVPVIAFFIVKEVFPWSIYVWLLPLIIGGMLVSYDEHLKFSSFFKKETVLILFALTLFSFGDTMGKLAIQKVDPFSYVGVLAAVTTLFSLGGFLVVRKKKTVLTARLLGKFTFLGSLVIFINLLLLLGIRDSITLTNAVAMLNVPFLLIFTFVLSRFDTDFVEKHPSRVYLLRFLGAIVMYFAALQVVFT